MESKDKSQRFTFEELNNKYGFDYKNISIKEGIHPTYKKHLEACWTIDSIWGHVQGENISTSKARELTSAVIEGSLESFRSRVIAELEAMKVNDRVYVENIEFLDKEKKKFNDTLSEAIEKIKNLK